MLGPLWVPTKPFCGYVNEDQVGTVLPGGGTHKHYMWSLKYFPPQVVGTLKPSIEKLLLPLLSVCSPSLPLQPFTPWPCPTGGEDHTFALFTPLCSLFAPFPSPLLPELPWSFPDLAPQVVGTIQPSIEMPPIGPHFLPSPKFLARGGDLWNPFVAMWMEFGEQRGKRAKGEQTGSLNRVFFTDSKPFSRIQGLFGDLGPFWGFGNFSGIQGLFRGFGPFFGDLWPFSGIHRLFADSWPFRGCRGLFQGFVAFSQIRGLFTDSRPFLGICGLFADSRPTRGAKGANEPPGETFATWFFTKHGPKIYCIGVYCTRSKICPREIIFRCCNQFEQYCPIFICKIFISVLERNSCAIEYRTFVEENEITFIEYWNIFHL